MLNNVIFFNPQYIYYLYLNFKIILEFTYMIYISVTKLLNYAYIMLNTLQVSIVEKQYRNKN